MGSIAEIEGWIRDAAKKAQVLVTVRLDDPADNDSALDQIGLSDGLEMIEEDLGYGELGLALEHLLYMVNELDLELDRGAEEKIRQAGAALGIKR